MTEARTIFHIDVNSAFLSWEAVYRINFLGEERDLRNMVSAIGGDVEKRHGIILAKSIPAKKYNIRTGESILEARQKCPHLLIMPPDYDLYESCSEAFMEILREYSDMVEQYSIDEAYIDVTDAMGLYSSPVDLASKIKDRIRDKLGFTVNIGISTNKLLAKMASDFTKPDRVHTLYPEEIPVKMWPLPVGDLFYVGRASQKKLYKLGIRTIGELAHADPQTLQNHMKSHGLLIWNYANGIDYSLVCPDIPANKGYGNSTTVAFDVKDAVTAKMVLLGLCETVGTRIRRDGAEVQVVSVGVRYQDDLSHESMQITLDEPTDITTELYNASCCLFDKLWDGKRANRHIGVHTAHVKTQTGCRQLSLFETKDYEKMKMLDKAVDSIRLKYGKEAVMRSVFLLNPGIDPMIGGISKEKRGIHQND